MISRGLRIQHCGTTLHEAWTNHVLRHSHTHIFMQVNRFVFEFNRFLLQRCRADTDDRQGRRHRSAQRQRLLHCEKVELDVSLITLDHGVFEVVATSGETLGGEDFNQRVLDYFVKVFKKKHVKDI